MLPIRRRTQKCPTHKNLKEHQLFDRPPRGTLNSEVVFNLTMSRTRNLGGRLAASVVLLLQLALAAALPLAHARADAAGFSQQVHIEAEGGSCIPHNDLDCQLCRQHTVPHFPAIVAGIPKSPPTYSMRNAPRASSSEPVVHLTFGSISPRAPPLA